jgi:hypothetical protein
MDSNRGVDPFFAYSNKVRYNRNLLKKMGVDISVKPKKIPEKYA